MVLAYTVLALVGEHLPPSYRTGIPFLIPLIGFAGGVGVRFKPDAQAVKHFRPTRRSCAHPYL